MTAVKESMKCESKFENDSTAYNISQKNFASFKIIKECNFTNARVSEFNLSVKVTLPVFMPVATYGAMRGVKFDNLEEDIILSNTYHLRNLNKNIKEFNGWKRGLLTDSGGFQIQSLPNEVTEEGVIFLTLNDDNKDKDKMDYSIKKFGKLFTPEDSMDVQMKLGADIIMQLDDVVNPTMPRELHEIAIRRSTEWLDRAILHIQKSLNIESSDLKRMKNSTDNFIPQITPNNFLNNSLNNNQILFPIVQGGLIDDLRLKSLKDILKRSPKGLAIGGLSGGENKEDFCKTVYFTVNSLRSNNYYGPIYIMGIGYPEDVVICCAMGTDMSDCVYPTRTARIGRMFSDTGDILVTKKNKHKMENIYESISVCLFKQTKHLPEKFNYSKPYLCPCRACKYSFAYLNSISGTPNFCTLLSEHNLCYMRNLTRRIRETILEETFPEFIRSYMNIRYSGKIPEWIKFAMRLLKIS